MTTITLQIIDMHCSNCAMRIETLEDELPGVQRISASYRKNQVEIYYDENQLSLSEIIQAIKEVGYTAVS